MAFGEELSLEARDVGLRAALFLSSTIAAAGRPTPDPGAETGRVADALRGFFNAISSFDRAALRAAVTLDYLLIEDGLVWNVDSLVAVVQEPQRDSLRRRHSPLGGERALSKGGRRLEDGALALHAADDRTRKLCTERSEQESEVSHLVTRRFDSADEPRRFEKGKFEMVRIGGVTIGRASYEPGWKWSEHVKPLVGTSSCQVSHVGLVVTGRAKVRMDDGREIELRPGDLFSIGPGHDSWVVGDEPYVSLHFMGANEYVNP